MWSAIVTTLLLAEVAFGGMQFKPDPRASPQQEPSEKLYFGDMALSPLQKFALNQTGESFNAVIGQHLRWKDAIIPYAIDCSIENNRAAVDAIHRAIHQWERKTCMKFVKWTDQEFHLTFFRDTHCWGNVGQVSYSKISVGDGCEYEHVMAHEIGHVVGLHHEHNRKDRDDWVKVHWENIGQFKDAFEIVQNTDPLGIKYDYESIMHYPWNAFSANGYITMEPIRPTNGKVPYIEISKDDIELVSRMYDCPAIEKKRKAQRFRQRVEMTDTNIWCVDQMQQCPMWKEWGHCFVESVKMACPKSCDPRCAPDATEPPPTEAPTTKPPATKPPATKAPVVTAKPTTAVVDKKLPTTHLPEGWPNRNYLGTGQLCLDYHTSCHEWAEMGECANNPGYMLYNCLWSCKKKGFDIQCDFETPRPPGGCTAPLGLGYGTASGPTIPDSAFSSQHYLSPGGGWTAPPHAARLYNDDNYDSREIGAWCAASHDPDYLQVDLGESKTITYIATQGRPKYWERISTFKIHYGDSPDALTTYQEHGEDRIFNGNCDHSSPVLNQFNVPFTARYIRFEPWQWNFPCLRMEFFGC